MSDNDWNKHEFFVSSRDKNILEMNGDKDEIVVNSNEPKAVIRGKDH